MEKSFLLAEKAGRLLGECLGGAVVKTSYSPTHNDFIWEVSGYPIYGSRGTGKVYIVFPAKTFTIRGGDVKYFSDGPGPGATSTRSVWASPSNTPMCTIVATLAGARVAVTA